MWILRGSAFEARERAAMGDNPTASRAGRSGGRAGYRRRRPFSAVFCTVVGLVGQPIDAGVCLVAHDSDAKTAVTFACWENVLPGGHFVSKIR